MVSIQHPEHEKPEAEKMNGCKKKYVVILVLGIVLAAIGGAMFPLVDYVIREEIKKKVIISNTSDTYDVWQNIPIPVYMQFWMFNVENHEEVLKGEKPYLTQKGPYTYREHRIKFDIEWHNNGTVSYRQNRTFHFVREMSVGPDSDRVLTINPLLSVVAQAIKWADPNIRDLLSVAMQISGADGLFTYRNVSQLLFGYPDPTLTLLSKIIPLWFNETVVGFFIRKNFTDDGLYTIYTGEKNIDQLGDINLYNGKRHVDLWTTESANMVNGSDGTTGPPFRFDVKYSPMFTSDLCRSIRGVYQKDVQSPQGISLRRFVGDKRDMLNATANPDNLGFCIPQSKCLPTGLLNSTLCQLPVDKFMIPLIFSFPHFLNADPSVQNTVIGLSPNQKEHETTVDVEPWTGQVMQVAKRIQVNFFVEKVPYFSQTGNVSKLYFPIFWLNESVVIDDKHADMVENQLFIPMKAAFGIKIVLLAIGGICIIVATGLFIWNRRRFKKQLSILNTTYSDTDNLTAANDDDDDQLLSNHNLHPDALHKADDMDGLTPLAIDEYTDTENDDDYKPKNTNNVDDELLSDHSTPSAPRSGEQTQLIDTTNLG